MKTQGKVWIVFDTENRSQSKPLSVVQAQVILLSIQPHNRGRFFLWTPGWTEWASVRDFLNSDQKYFVSAHPPQPDVEKTQAITTPKESKIFPDEDTVTAILDSIADNNSPYTTIMTENPIKEVKDSGYYDQDFHGNDLDLAKVQKVKPMKGPKIIADVIAPDAERRRDARHNFKIEVVLVSKTKSFRTSSKNMSLSGTMLEKEIPKEFLGKHFDLIIVNPFEPNTTKSRLLFRAKIVGDLSDPRRLMFIEQDTQMTARLDALLQAYVAYQEKISKTSA